MNAAGKKILVMAGGTGGHVFPALATARELEHAGAHIEWLGSTHGMENDLIPAQGIKLHRIQVRGLRGKGKLSLLLAPFKVVLATWQALSVVRAYQPDLVLGMGGFAAGPGGAAAWLTRTPLVIHEQNAIAGMTNRLLARVANRVLEAFKGGFGQRNNVTEVGNPVRGPILNLASPRQRITGRSGPLRILVVGGSLGAQAINQAIPELLARLPEAQRPDIWHQAGKRNIDAVLAHYQQLGVSARVEPFIDQMDQAYAWADLVICRAGALTVSELAIAGVASILVPLPIAVDDHQTANARFLADSGAAILLPQPELNADKLITLLQQLNDRNQLLQMAEQAQALARPEASKEVARICLETSK